MSIKQVNYYITVKNQEFHLGEMRGDNKLSEDEGFPTLVEQNSWLMTNKLVDIIEETDNYSSLIEAANFLKLTKFNGYLGKYDFLKILFELLLESGGTIVAKVVGESTVNLLAYQDLHDKNSIVGQKATLTMLGGGDL